VPTTTTPESTTPLKQRDEAVAETAEAKLAREATEVEPGKAADANGKGKAAKPAKAASAKPAKPKAAKKTMLQACIEVMADGKPWHQNAIRDQVIERKLHPSYKKAHVLNLIAGTLRSASRRDKPLLTQTAPSTFKLTKAGKDSLS